jgi:hypothetical protein
MVSHGDRIKPRVAEPSATAREREKKSQGKISMSAASMTMLTDEDIRTEFGWNDDMIYSLLQNPDSPHARRNKAHRRIHIWAVEA